MSASLSPRHSISRQWTELPGDFLEKIKTVFNGQFKTEAQYGEFLAEGRIYPGEILLRVGFLESGRLKQINFEASMDLPPAEPTAEVDAAESKTMEKIYTCLDAIGSLMEEYFELDEEEDELSVPLTWQETEFEGETLFLKHSTVNTRLEEEADRILGLIEKQLVHEDLASEDALANAEIDNELAHDIQKAIRSGKYPRGAGHADLGQEPESES